MELICVNAQVIYNPTLMMRHLGADLVEGNKYTTNCKPFVDSLGMENYLIEGIGPRLKCRFAELLENDFVKEAEKAIEKLKEEYELTD